MSFDAIRAQPVAVRTLKKALESDRLGGSYLFEGPAGVGKLATAFALAQAANCVVKPGLGCGTCTTCDRIRRNAHQDVRVFAPREEGNRNLQVEVIRQEVIPFTQFAPFEAPRAFLVFPEADVSFPEKHPEAANALLKTLEEPRRNVHFVLLAERPDRLLPTIRSRCQRVRFQRLPDVALDAILDANGVDMPKRAPAIALANGSASRALTLAGGEGVDRAEVTYRILDTLERGKSGELVHAAEEIARRDDAVLVLETLLCLYRDIAVIGLVEGPGAPPFTVTRDTGATRDRSRTVSASRAAQSAELVAQAIEDIDRAGAPQAVLDSLFHALAPR